MNWNFLDKISNQVKLYSNILGQLWFLSLFVFRFIVVVSIGAPVYHDEQASFKCATKETGCNNVCFNAFSKISHIRFWSFQLLALATPIIFFHLYTMMVTEEIKNVQSLESKCKEPDNPEMGLSSLEEKRYRKMSKRKKTIGRVREKQSYVDGNLKKVQYTRKIQIAYFISVMARIPLEACFIYLGYKLFKFDDPTDVGGESFLDFLLYKVPSLFRCTGDYPNVYAACHQQIGLVDNAYVPCWVSRPYEKTIFINYMSVVSGTGFLLCVSELLYLMYRGMTKCRHRYRFISRVQKNAAVTPGDDVFSEEKCASTSLFRTEGV